MSVLSLLMLQNRESHPVANRKNGRGAPLTINQTLYNIDVWDENSIAARGADTFIHALKIWPKG